MVDWLDGDDGAAPAVGPAPTVQANARGWPIIAVLVVSAVGIVFALMMWLLARPMLAAIAYGAVLFAGCGLLGYRRYDAIVATRSAGGSGITVIQPIEKAAIGVLVLSCLANGVVVAMEVSRWGQ